MFCVFNVYAYCANCFFETQMEYFDILGISPVFHNLFSLASADISYWYPPTHVFNVSEEAITVHYRVR